VTDTVDALNDAFQTIMDCATDDDLHRFISSLDEKQIDREILNDTREIFQPLQTTFEPTGEKNLAGMSEDDQALVEEIQDRVMGTKIEARLALRKLQKLKRKYPHVPLIYNFMGIAYQTLNDDTRRYHIIKQTRKKFPDYLFGMISLAEYRLSHFEHEDIPNIFNHKMQLHMHRPDAGDSPVFHASEVQSFYCVTGRYYARNQQFAHAIKCYFIIKRANPDCPHLTVLAREIFIAETAVALEAGFESMTGAREEFHG